MGGTELLEARRGHAPFLAAVSLGWSCLGKCSMDSSLPVMPCCAWAWHTVPVGFLGGEESLLWVVQPGLLPCSPGTVGSMAWLAVMQDHSLTWLRDCCGLSSVPCTSVLS